MINLDKLDPDWEFAKVHGKASFAGMPVSSNLFSEITMQSENNSDKNVLCKCCYEHVYKTKVPLCENSK